MTNFPTVQNPKRFVWDFWYWHDPINKLFHLLYLNADSELVATNQHHFSSRIGYATTKDFKAINWINNDVFHANDSGWDNTSIWSGDVIKTADGFRMFYTSRDKNIDDGLTQYIGCATSNEFLSWERRDNFILKADERWYETASLKGDNTVHAWRDPFLFRDNDETWMLLSAKAKALPIKSKGCVALLKAHNNDLLNWTIQTPLFNSGWYSECEVPQLYLNEKNQKILVFSSWAKYDHAPASNGRGGLHAYNIDDQSMHVLLPESEGLYACRVIPELNGNIVGFDIKHGGLRRVDVETGLYAVDRDFSKIEYT